jgi:hypothetical protein
MTGGELPDEGSDGILGWISVGEFLVKGMFTAWRDVPGLAAQVQLLLLQPLLL